MKKKRWLAVLLTAVMITSVGLTACTPNTGETDAGKAADSGADTGSTAEETAPAEKDEAQTAQNTETPAGAAEDWMTPFEETVKLRVVVGWDADPSIKEGTTPETNALLTLAKDMLNIDLEILWMVPNDQLEEKFALQISSGDIPDVMMLNSKLFYEFRDNGQLRDLSEAFDKYGSDLLKQTVSSFGPEPINYSSADGKLYGMPALLDTAEGVPGIYYRSDWLNAVGMEVPKNTEELNQMLIKLAEYGKTVNGGKDVAGLGTTSSVFDTGFGLNPYFQCYGAYPGKWVMRDGKLINGMVQDEMVAALDGLRELYEKGGLAVDFATWNSDQFNERVTNDQVGASCGSYWIPAWPLNLNKAANPEAEWAELKLVSPDGTGAKPAMNQVSINHFNVVNKDAPKEAEEAMIKLLNLGLATSTNATGDKTIFGGLDKPANGGALFYLPVYMYYPTPWVEWRTNINKAYETKDTSILKSQTELEWYGYMDDWLTNGNESKDLGTSWGMYKSRVAPDSGIAIGLEARETGNYEPCYFYGAATPTEQRVASSLQDTTITFVIDYIMGKKTSADWDAFKKSWYDMGGDKWTQEVNEQYQSIIGQ